MDEALPPVTPADPDLLREVMETGDITREEGRGLARWVGAVAEELRRALLDRLGDQPWLEPALTTAFWGVIAIAVILGVVLVFPATRAWVRALFDGTRPVDGAVRTTGPATAAPEDPARTLHHHLEAGDAPAALAALWLLLLHRLEARGLLHRDPGTTHQEALERVARVRPDLPRLPAWRALRREVDEARYGTLTVTVDDVRERLPLADPDPP